MKRAEPVSPAQATNGVLPVHPGMPDDVATGASGDGLTRRRALLAGAAAAATSVLAFSPKVGAQAVRAQTAAAKPPSEFTKAAHKRVLDTLPFHDRTDFEYAQRGFIAGLPGNAIKDAQGKVVLDLKTLQVPTDAPAPDTMNPSLWRVSQLNSFAGLFRVVDRLYQVRNIDITNITFIEGETGIIVIDPCVSPLAARAALDLYFAHRPSKPVTAVLYTHSHIDHFGGVGAVTTAEDVAAGKTKIIASAGFTEEAVSENIYAGNAMIRRVMYMGGNPLHSGDGREDRTEPLDLERFIEGSNTLLGSYHPARAVDVMFAGV